VGAGAADHRQTRVDDACGISFLMVGDNKQSTFYGSDKTAGAMDSCDIHFYISAVPGQHWFR
jgi:ketopantoate hydroxymethyltransferase